MRHVMREDLLEVSLEGRIDATNAQDVEQELLGVIGGAGARRVRLDVGGLSYISSSGLRLVVRLLRRCDEVSVVNAAPGIYDVFEMTGFTELLPVSRQPREISLEGMRQIGAGAFGRVYRLDAERVVKVYDAHANPLDQIERERRSAREVFIHDVPSAMPFDTVRVGGDYGITYELIDALTLGEAIVKDPDRLDELAQGMAQLLEKLHTTHFEEGLLPDARLIFHRWVDVAERSELYDDGTIAKLREVVEGIPQGDTFVHGDFHPANIMVMPDGELVLIDMGDASVGDPIIDLAGLYHVVRVAARRPGGSLRLTGMPLDMLDRVWGVFVRAYFGARDADEIATIERRLAFWALPRTMGSTARSKLITDDARARQAAELERAFLAGYEAQAGRGNGPTHVIP